MAIRPEVLTRAGIALSPERFTALVEEVVAEFPVQGATTPLADFSPAEAEALREGGLDLSPLRPDEDDPLARTAATYATLIATSLRVPEAAQRLRVDDSRVRQRLAARTLYGIKCSDGWHIPLFQFDGDHLVPNLGVVVSHLPADVHPVSVFRWFLAPDPDLSVDGVARSPRDWLRMGNDPAPAATLAAVLVEAI
jgi:hypothetical protein